MNNKISMLVLGPLAAAALVSSSHDAEACMGTQCFAATSGDVLEGEYTGTTGNGNGVKGTNSSSGTTAAGVKGENSGLGYGVWGAGSSGIGVYGSTTGASPAVLGAGVPELGTFPSIGVEGTCGGSTSNNYAVYGVSGGGSSWAGYFSGNVNVTGEFDSNGTCEFNCSSDRRLKQNIQPLSGALDQLLQLKGVTYEWKTPDDHGHPTGMQTGFIAQEVETVFPKWVDEHTDGFKAITLPPMQLAAMQVESIRTLKSENDQLKAQLGSLNNRLKVIESGRQPVATGLGFGGGASLGMFGLAVGAVIVSRRKKEERS
jgi:hypothetical protein